MVKVIKKSKKSKFFPGKLWSKAVELARIVSPDQVVQMEEEWGDSLVEK